MQVIRSPSVRQYLIWSYFYHALLGCLRMWCTVRYVLSATKIACGLLSAKYEYISLAAGNGCSRMEHRWTDYVVRGSVTYFYSSLCGVGHLCNLRIFVTFQSPYIIFQRDIAHWTVPYIINGCLAMTSVILVMVILPETRGRPMPEEVPPKSNSCRRRPAQEESDGHKDGSFSEVNV
jgi:hypothetical protein